MQDDLISRQAAIDFIDAGHLVNPNEPRWSDNEVVNFLKSRPSAEPEIITCENCKYGDTEPVADGRRWCDRHGAYMKYCSDAEVREDEETDIS